MPKKIVKISLVLLLAIVVIAFFVLDLQQYLTLDYIKQQQHILEKYYVNNTFEVLVIFSVAYIMVTALSLPVASILTLGAGALFGLPIGIVIVSFTSTIGATLAFLMARFLVHDYIQTHYAKPLAKIHAGFKREGAFYLFALRLVPLFPFFVVNILMALMPIKVWTFYWVSQLGMLAATVVYVYAGTQLVKITSLSDITSPSLLLAFTLLGVFPLIAKKLVKIMRKEKAHASI